MAMLDFFYGPNWGRIYDFLMSGRPPILVQLLALNALFLAIVAIRKAAGARHLGAGATLLSQLGILGANLVVLYQQQLEDFIRPMWWS